MNVPEGFYEIEDVASPLKLSADMRIAAKIHEAWQAGWKSKNTLPDGSIKPRPKPTDDARWIEKNGGATSVDIANTTFVDLPINRQLESLDGAAGTFEDVRLEAEKGTTIDIKDEALIEVLAVREHVRWVVRDKRRPLEDQQQNLHVGFNELDDWMKEENRKVARQAVTEFMANPPRLRTPEEVRLDTERLLPLEERMELLRKRLEARAAAGQKPARKAV